MSGKIQTLMYDFFIHLAKGMLIDATGDRLPYNPT